jgi:PAS domain S-box-containing protein
VVATKDPPAPEEALREAELRALRLIDSIKDYAIFMLDAEGRIETWNRGAEQITGYAPDEVLGNHFELLYTAEARRDGLPRRLLAEAEALGRVGNVGWRIKKDGSRFWADVVITVLTDDSGRAIGFAIVNRDLTERRLAEETARKLAVEQAARFEAEQAEVRNRENEERYRELSERLEIILEGVQDGITVQEPSGQMIFANSAAARLLGYASREAVLALTSEQRLAGYELTDTDGAPIPADRLPGRRALRGEEPEPLELQVRDRATGRTWWCLLRATLVPERPGRPRLAVNIFHDLTRERRQAEAERFLADASATLTRSLDRDTTLESLARVLVPDLGDWCAIHLLLDGQLRVVALAHRDPKHVALGRQLAERFPLDLAAKKGPASVLRTGASELYTGIDASLFDGRPAEQAAALRGLGFHAMLIVPIRAKDRILGVMTLIAAESRRRYDEADVALAEELGRRAGIAIDNAWLYEKARLAIKGRDDFLSVASHELRTPLTSLELHLSALENAAKRDRLAQLGPEKVAHRLGKAHEQVGRLTALIEELLDVSRIQGGHLELRRESFELSALAREVAERFELEAERAGSEVVVRAPGPLEGRWDRSRLDQVITNLLSNALKYGAGRPVELAIEAKAGLAVLSVTDHGIGISDEDQARIFDRFERTEAARNFGGLGLGLWIVRRICEAHGGRASVASRIGSGASFSLELPLE